MCFCFRAVSRWKDLWEFLFLQRISIPAYQWLFLSTGLSLFCVRTSLKSNAAHWFPIATLLSKCCQAICRLLQDADLYVLITFSSQLWWSPLQRSNKIKPLQCNFTGRCLEVVKSFCTVLLIPCLLICCASEATALMFSVRPEIRSFSILF